MTDLKNWIVETLQAATDAHPAIDRKYVERLTDDWTADDDQEIDTIHVDAILDADRLATIIGQLVHDAQMDAFARGRLQGFEDARKLDARRLK